MMTLPQQMFFLFFCFFSTFFVRTCKPLYHERIFYKSLIQDSRRASEEQLPGLRGVCQVAGQFAFQQCGQVFRCELCQLEDKDTSTLTKLGRHFVIENVHKLAQ